MKNDEIYVIETVNLSKSYKTYKTKWSRLLDWLGFKHQYKHNWVLKNINFKLKAGESLGIIGYNGAGKSTLLKLITGAALPTEGHVKVSGRVTALLELGLGFHPDFTGMQNIFLSANLNGLSNEEITSLLPQIQNFAELGDYINKPVKTYSSGMVVRLAFAVATAVRPDVLIVDEALSVGDTYFQHKCFKLIREYKNHGTSILFVSHDPGAVKNLCERAILLDGGSLIRSGTPEQILDYYNAIIAKRENNYIISQNEGRGTRSGSGLIKITNVDIKCDNISTRTIQVGDEVQLIVETICNEKIPSVTAGFIIKDRLGNDIYGTNTFFLNSNITNLERNSTVTFSFQIKINLGLGNYSVTVALHEGYNHIENNFDWWDNVLQFQVVSAQEADFVGICHLPASVTITK